MNNDIVHYFMIHVVLACVGDGLEHRLVVFVFYVCPPEEILFILITSSSSIDSIS